MVVHQVDLYKVQQIRTLGKGEDGKARELLESVAKQVQPLLRRHQLHVPLLTEFFPANPNLLGLNVGGGGGSTSEIRIRLRRAGRELEFYHYEHVLGTMLHELAHNHRGPHDAAFYKLLDQYTQECEELMSKGISGTGQGFDAAPAGKVGGRFVGRGELPPHQRRELALKAAQERAKKQSLMPSGPRKLGGDLTLRLTADPRQAAALAAERRARDNLWCPAETIEQEATAGHDVVSAIQQVLNNAGERQQPRQEEEEQQQQQREQHRGGGTAPVRGRPLSENASAEPAGAAAAGRESQGQRQQWQGGAAAGQSDAIGQWLPLPTGAVTPSGAQEPPGVPSREAADETDFIDLTGEDGEENEGPGRRSAGAAAVAAGAACLAPPVKRRRPLGGGRQQQQQQEQQEQQAASVWACPACTLRNRGSALQCDACGGPKPTGFTS